MEIPVTRAKARLTDLVRRAEHGEEVVLTRFGRAAVRLTPVVAKPAAADRRRLLERIRASGSAKARRGPGAARSQDFLYDNAGLPK